MITISDGLFAKESTGAKVWKMSPVAPELALMLDTSKEYVPCLIRHGKNLKIGEFSSSCLSLPLVTSAKLLALIRCWGFSPGSLRPTRTLEISELEKN